MKSFCQESVVDEERMGPDHWLGLMLHVLRFFDTNGCRQEGHPVSKKPNRGL